MINGKAEGLKQKNTTPKPCACKHTCMRACVSTGACLCVCECVKTGVIIGVSLQEPHAVLTQREWCDC